MKTRSTTIFAAVVFLITLAACAKLTDTPTPTPVPIVPTPQYPHVAPYLLDPEDGLSVKTAEVLLNWRFKEKLGPNEHFDVRVWRDGETPAGIAWADEDKYDLTNYLRTNGPGVYHWSIAVIRGQEGKFEADLSPASPTWTLTVTEVPTPVPPEATVIVPVGFKVQLFGIATYPTSLAFGSDGTLYVSQQGGDIVAFKDDDGDGYADRGGKIATGFKTPLGLAMRGTDLYVSDSGEIDVLHNVALDKTDMTATQIITGLPSFIYDSHSNNGIAFGPDGRLYIPIGATTDHGPGEPVSTAARVLVANMDGSDLETYATGFRNPYKVIFDQSGRMFVDDNGADQSDQIMPFIPADELNLVVEGGDYGFPDVFGNPPPGSKTIGPIAMFEAHSIPTGMTIVPSDTASFPAQYRGDIFVALWGTQPLGSSAARGHDVVSVHLTNTPVGVRGTVTPFMTNITHPIGVIFGPDGALYIADWQQGFIFRVTYSK